MKTVVIADDHAFFRSTLTKFLSSSFSIVGEASNANSALELVQENKPDLILLDLSMPIRSGFSVIESLKQCDNQIKILVLTMFNSAKYARIALKAGADGYCLKDDVSATLRSAIARVMNGEKYLDPNLKEE